MNTLKRYQGIKKNKRRDEEKQRSRETPKGLIKEWVIIKENDSI